MTNDTNQTYGQKALLQDPSDIAAKPLLALDALSKLYRQFATKPDFQSLIQTLLLTLSGQFAVTSTYAVLRKPGALDQKCTYKGTGKFKVNPQLESLTLTPDIAKYFLDNRTTCLVSDLKLPISASNHASFLHNNGVSIVSPLIHNDNLLGIIGLSERITKKPFAPDDIELLGTMINTNTPLIVSSYHFWEMTNLSAWHLDILNNVKQSVFVFDQDDHLRKVNTVGQKILNKFIKGTQANRLLNGLHGSEVFPEEIFPNWFNEFSKTNIETTGTIENLVTSLDGVKYVFDAYVAGISTRTQSSCDYIITLDDVTERKKLEQIKQFRFECIQRQIKAIARLATEETLKNGDVEQSARIITEVIANAMEVERISIWLLDAKNTQYRCIDQFERSKQIHSVEAPIDASKYPNYFKALEMARVIDAENARLDSRTREFAESHLIPSGITSMLDAPIRVSGKVVGVVCQEHVGPEREWMTDEVRFAGEVADQMAQVISIAERIQINEQKRGLQEKLEKAEKMESLGILAGGVAHDLNNMLGPLVGYPELILRKLPQDSPFRKQILRISAAAQSAADVIQDLLTLARRGRYEMEPTDLNEVIESYLDSPSFIHLTAKHSGISVQISLDKSIDAMVGSTSHLSKAVMNLITNAFDAMADTGSLKIETSQVDLNSLINGEKIIEPGSYLLFKVSDTGQGISAEDQRRIFEPYYSKKKMLTSSGSGLGLSVVHGILRDHGGYYDIISQPGEGTEFILYFPATNQTVENQSELTTITGGTEMVLVVDDSPEQRDIAEELLSGLGYKVDTVGSGRETLEYLKHKQVDIVVLDMIMEKDFDGLDTYRAIIKLYPKQKAIIVSGFSQTERVDQTRKLGAGPYIKKPYTLATIGNTIRNELDKDCSPIIAID